jgi:hypothetical protein
MVSGRSIMFIGGRGMAPQPSDVLEAGADRPAVLHLTPGKPQALPAHRAGAVRVRALPADAPEVAPKGAGEVVAGLEAAVDPGLLWQRAIDLHVRRALDDQGQILRPIPTALAAPAGNAQGPNIWIQGIPLVPEEDTSTPGPSRLAVRLRAGAKPSRKLEELSGTLLMQVQTPAETLVAVGDILTAAGRTVRGAAGGTVRVLEVERPEEGGVRLRIQVEGVPRSLKDNTPPVLNVSVMVDGRLVTGGDGSLNSTHFDLLDDRGQPLRIVRAVNTGKRAGNAQEYELTYRPRWGQGTPARFLYRDRRTAVVEVPFTLKDVTLP